MKPVKREWMLTAAFAFFWLFIISQNTFILGTPGVSLEKRAQIHILHSAGMLLGAFLLPLLLPLGALRVGGRPPKYGLRLALIGLLFLPNIIVRLLGQQAWMASLVNSALMALCNGVTATLLFGCFMNLSGEKGIFWRTLIYSIGYILHNLVLGPGRGLLLPLMFGSAGFLLTCAGVLILVFLAGIKPGLSKRNTEEKDLEISDSRDEANSEQVNAKRFDLRCILPAFAALVILWTNSLTDQLFTPTLNTYFPPGFHPTIVVVIFVLPVLGFIAYRWQRQFRIMFVPVSSFLFLFIPSLLLFNRSEPLFLVLYTLNLIMVQTMVQLFPFVIIGLYWQKKPNGGYWAYLLAASIHIIHTNSFALVGPFKALSLDNAYAVILLSLAAVAYYLLSRKSVAGVKHVEAAAESTAIPAKSLEEIFKEHGLSEREAEVALLMAQEGLSTKEMGERLFISPLTVRDHTTSIYRKFGVKGRAEFMVKILNNK